MSIMQRQSGMSLVEVLIAWSLLSTVLVAFLHYQQQALCQVRQTDQRSQAMVLLMDVFSVNCAPILWQPSGQWYQHWQSAIHHLFPHGSFILQCDELTCRAQIRWYDHGWQHWQRYCTKTPTTRPEYVGNVVGDIVE